MTKLTKSRGFDIIALSTNLKKRFMQKRFIVRPVKIVWRNSMIAGNPITRSFQKFGVYDRNWQNDNYCWCPNPGGKFVSDWQARKYRVVVDNEGLAKQIGEKL